MNSPPYISSRAYIKKFCNLVLILFDYTMVHGRMLKEAHLWVESYIMSLGRAIIAYQFIKHEVGRIEILHFRPMIEHGMDGAPCRNSFKLITYMDSHISKEFPSGEEKFGSVFKGMKKVMGTCSMFSTLNFTPTIVLIDIWK